MSISAGDIGHSAESASTSPGIPSPGGSLHLSGVEYDCTFSLITDATGKISFAVPDPVRFSFAFETGATEVSPGVIQVSWDFSWFDQNAVEADIALALSQIVASVAVLLGRTIDEVNQTVLVRRVWTFAPNVQGPDTGSGRVVVVDVMKYPPRTAADGVRRVVESGQVSVAVAVADRTHAREAAYGFGGDFAHAAESASHVP
jgi:hypothetical protein